MESTSNSKQEKDPSSPLLPPTSSLPLKRVVSSECDSILIKYAQEAIQSIKQHQHQCNLKSIFTFLKANYSSYHLVESLTEKELMSQLELGVKCGILSRKFGASSTSNPSQQPNQNSQKSNSFINSPIYNLPLFDDQPSHLSETERQDLNLILQLLIKTVASLNKQNFNDFDQTPNASPLNENTCDLCQVCSYLTDNFKFNLTEPNELLQRLKKISFYLLHKNDKIFLKELNNLPGDQTEHESNYKKFKFKLNSVYVRRKLQQNLTIASQAQAKANTENLEKQQKPTQTELESSVLPSDLTTDLIENLLGFKAPYSPEQILKIETLKKRALLPSERANKTVNSSSSDLSSSFSSSPIRSPSERDSCSFCLRPEKSNPLGQLDKFLTCSDCASSAHTFCLKYSPSLIEYLKTAKNVKWQCIECKKCSVCLKASESMLLCDRCDRGYHKECCSPPLHKRPKGQFVCHVCKYLDDLNQSSKLNPNPSQALIGSTRKKRKLSVSASLTDVASWNKNETENLKKYVKKTKFNQVVKEVEISNQAQIEQSTLNTDNLPEEPEEQNAAAENDDPKGVHVPANLIDGMTAFFTPSNRQRHHSHYSNHDQSHTEHNLIASDSEQLKLRQEKSIKSPNTSRTQLMIVKKIIKKSKSANSNSSIQREKKSKKTAKTAKPRLKRVAVNAITKAETSEENLINSNLNSSDKENQQKLAEIKPEDELKTISPSKSATNRLLLKNKSNKESDLVDESDIDSGSKSHHKTRGDRLDNLVDSLSHIYCTDNETRSHKLPQKFTNMIVTKQIKRQRKCSSASNQSSSTLSQTTSPKVKENLNENEAEIKQLVNTPTNKITLNSELRLLSDKSKTKKTKKRIKLNVSNESLKIAIKEQVNIDQENVKSKEDDEDQDVNVVDDNTEPNSTRNTPVKKEKIEKFSSLI